MEPDDTVAVMPLALTEYPAAIDTSSVSMPAPGAFLLLIAVAGLTSVFVMMEYEAPRGTLVLDSPAPAAFPLLDHLPAHFVRATALAEVTGARPREEAFTV